MSRRSRPAWVYVVLTALLAVLLLTLWLGEDSGNRHAVPQQVRVPDVVFEESGLHDIGPSQLPVSVGTKAAPEPLKHRGIALILDDVGYDLPALRRALALQIPMAIAILPNAPHAVEAARPRKSNQTCVSSRSYSHPVFYIGNTRQRRYAFLDNILRSPESRMQQPDSVSRDNIRRCPRPAQHSSIS